MFGKPGNQRIPKRLCVTYDMWYELMNTVTRS